MPDEWKQTRFNGVLVSSCGLLRRWDDRRRSWTPSYLPKAGPQGYRYTSIGGRKLAVHQLVAEAFLGPAPDGETVDHIDRDRGNNAICNLEYKSATEQMVNRKDLKVRRDSRKITVWRIGQEEHAQLYDSCHRACRELGLDEGNLSRAARSGKTCKGFRARFQTVDESLVHPDEEFRLVRGQFRVSQYGRAITTRGACFPYTPTPATGAAYASVGQNVLFHHLVAEAWPEIVGYRHSHNCTIDHIDRDRRNNAASNLRWADETTQKQNQNRVHKEEREVVKKIEVEASAPGTNVWTKFTSFHDASSKLSTNGIVLPDGSISRCVRGATRSGIIKRGPFSGWKFRVPDSFQTNVQLH